MGRGRRTAGPNAALAAALTQTSIGPSSARKLTLATNTLAPTTGTLQNLRPKMSQTVIDTNKQDMQAKRSMVKEANIREHPPVTRTPDI